MVTFLTHSKAHIEQIAHMVQHKERLYHHLDTFPEDSLGLLEALHSEFDFLEKHKFLAYIPETEKHACTKEQAFEIIDLLFQESALSADMFASTKLGGKSTD
jgi:hypothetical protein